MVRNKVYPWIALAALALGSCLLGWGLWPLPQGEHTAVLSAVELGIPELGLVLGECRLQAITWPALLRVGDSAVIELELTPQQAADCGQLPETAVTTAATLVADLRLNGVEVIPHGQLSRAWVAGQPMRLSWQIQARQTGEFSGALWLHLQPSLTGAEDYRHLLSAYRFSVKVISLAGLSGRAARVIGSVVLVVGLAWLLVGLLLGGQDQMTHL